MENIKTSGMNEIECEVHILKENLSSLIGDLRTAMALIEIVDMTETRELFIKQTRSRISKIEKDFR